MAYFNYNRKLAFDALSKAVSRGTDLLSPNLSEQVYQQWQQFVREILEISTKENPAVLLNYLDYQIDLSKRNLIPYEKLSLSIKYLLDVMKML